MVIELTEKVMYLSVIGLLMTLQVVQWYHIKKLKDSVQTIWGNIAILALTLSYHSKQNENQQVEQEQPEERLG